MYIIQIATNTSKEEEIKQELAKIFEEAEQKKQERVTIIETINRKYKRSIISIYVNIDIKNHIESIKNIKADDETQIIIDKLKENAPPATLENIFNYLVK